MTSPHYPMDSGLSVFGPADGGLAGEQAAGSAATRRPGAPVPTDPAEVRWAMLAYLGVPFTLCVAAAGRLPGQPGGTAGSPASMRRPR